MKISKIISMDDLAAVIILMIVITAICIFAYNADCKNGFNKGTCLAACGNDKLIHYNNDYCKCIEFAKDNKKDSKVYYVKKRN